MRRIAVLGLAMAVLLGVPGTGRADTSMRVEWLTSLEAARDLDETVVFSKVKIERPVKLAIASEPERLLAEDTRINERLRAEQIHAMLSTAPLPTPADLSTRIYEEVLHVAVTDPHLGLGHILFGAEGETR